MERKDDGSVVPVAYWYSDEEKNNALPNDKKITKFEEGKTYQTSDWLTGGIHCYQCISRTETTVTSECC